MKLDQENVTNIFNSLASPLIKRTLHEAKLINIGANIWESYQHALTKKLINIWLRKCLFERTTRRVDIGIQATCMMRNRSNMRKVPYLCCLLLLDQIKHDTTSSCWPVKPYKKQARSKLRNYRNFASHEAVELYTGLKGKIDRYL